MGFIAYDPSCTSFCFTRGQEVGIGFLKGISIGLLPGAIIGSVVREERWNPVSLPAPVASGLSIRPVIGSRVGFAGSIRVGGL